MNLKNNTYVICYTFLLFHMLHILNNTTIIKLVFTLNEKKRPSLKFTQVTNPNKSDIDHGLIRDVVTYLIIIHIMIYLTILFQLSEQILLLKSKISRE